MELLGPAGTLETLITTPQDNPVAVGIICHPHPLQEGTMHNKVVTTLAKAYDLCGAVTIRFNFRGVGASEGVFDQAKGECDDLRVVVRWAETHYPGLPIWLAGFSFGSYIAARVAYDDGIAQSLISIAPPVGKGSYYDFASLSEMQQPWLVIQGDKDEIVSFDQVVTWWQERNCLAHQELNIIQDTGHFFHRRLIELRTIVTDWIKGL